MQSYNYQQAAGQRPPSRPQSRPSTGQKLHRLQTAPAMNLQMQQFDGIDEGERMHLREAISSPKKTNVPLLTFDIKMDQLRNFLQNMTTVVNDHAKLLQLLQDQMMRRVNDTQMGDILQAIAKSTPDDAMMTDPKSLSCMHKHIALIKEQLFGNQLGMEDFKNLKIGADQFADKMKCLGSSVAFLLRTRGNVQERLQAQDEKLAGKADLASMKAKFKRRKKKFHTKIQDGDDLVTQQQEELRAKVENRMTQLSDQIKQNQENTVWKINDCRQLLKNRVTDDFVHEVTRNLEQRMMRSLKERTHSYEEKVESSISDFKRLFKQLEDKVEGKVSGIKERVDKVEKEITLKADQKVLDEFIRQNQVKEEKFKNDIEDLGSLLKKHDTQFIQIYKMLKSRPAPSIPAPAPVIVSEPRGPQIDPSRVDDIGNLLIEQQAKMEQLGRQIQKLRRAAQSQENRLNRTQSLLPNKVDREQIRDVLFASQAIERLKGQLAKLRSDTDANFRAMQAKFNKIRPDEAIKALQRALKLKAPLQDTNSSLTNHEIRLKNLDAILKQINDEMEAFAKALKQTQDFIDSIGYNKSEILAGTKGMNCLVCGRNQVGQTISAAPSSMPIFDPVNDTDILSRGITPKEGNRGLTIPTLKKKIKVIRNESVREVRMNQQLDDNGGGHGSFGIGVGYQTDRGGHGGVIGSVTPRQGKTQRPRSSERYFGTKDGSGKKKGLPFIDGQQAAPMRPKPQ